MMEDLFCLSCGKCCHWVIDGKVMKCRFLVKRSSGRTHCRIYHHRLGTLLYRYKDGTKRIKICNIRANAQWNYEGCPNNRKGLPLFDDEVKKVENNKT